MTSGSIYDIDESSLCRAHSVDVLSTGRRYICSLAVGHVGAHRAHKFHRLTSPAVWYGPWLDGSPWTDEEGVYHGIIASDYPGEPDPAPVSLLKPHRCVFCRQVMYTEKPEIHETCTSAMNYQAAMLRMMKRHLAKRLAGERHDFIMSMRDMGCTCSINFSHDSLETTWYDHGEWCPLPKLLEIINEDLRAMGYSNTDPAPPEVWQELIDGAREHLARLARRHKPEPEDFSF